MSPTIRVSERAKNAIESYQASDQSLGDAVEEMAEELGLFGDRRLKDLRTRLSDEYGLENPEIDDILAALRIIYTKHEGKKVPEKTLTEFESEVGILSRLELVELDTSTDTAGYHLTEDGEVIAAAVTTHHIDENEDDLQVLIGQYQALPLAFYIEFGFKPTRSAHLSTNRNLVEESEWVTASDIRDEYTAFREDLTETGFAVRNEWREDRVNRRSETPIYVLPPEFKPTLAAFSAEIGAALSKMEAYRVVNAVIEGELAADSRERMVDMLTVADEADLENHVNQLHDRGLTSRYSRQETPFFVTDPGGFRTHVQSIVTEEMDK